MNKNFNSKNQKSVLNMQKKINYKFHQEKKNFFFPHNNNFESKNKNQ